MLSERLQILVSTDQRRRLEREARRRGTSVGSLVRDAVDAHLGGPTRAQKQEALGRIRAMHGSFLTPDELNRIIERERDEQADAMLDRREP